MEIPCLSRVSVSSIAEIMERKSKVMEDFMGSALLKAMRAREMRRVPCDTQRSFKIPGGRSDTAASSS